MQHVDDVVQIVVGCVFVVAGHGTEERAQLAPIQSKVFDDAADQEQVLAELDLQVCRVRENVTSVTHHIPYIPIP
jgi:hypothetical protein